MTWEILRTFTGCYFERYRWLFITPWFAFEFMCGACDYLSFREVYGVRFYYSPVPKWDYGFGTSYFRKCDRSLSFTKSLWERETRKQL